MGQLLLGTLLLLILATACATTPEAADRGRSHPSTAKRLYEKSCSRCHALYMPRSFFADEWKFYVRKYGRKARLTQEQKDLVYGYLAQNARAG